jgi:hypothetical protein
MSKYYAQWRRPKMAERKWKVHPIWRGIGCLMIFLIPLFSFLVAGVLVEANFEQGWLAIPYNLLGPAGMPVENLYLKLIGTALVSVILFAGYTIVYMVIYSMLGPGRYGPLDARPMRRKPGERRRKAGRR